MIEHRRNWLIPLLALGIAGLALVSVACSTDRAPRQSTPEDSLVNNAPAGHKGLVQIDGATSIFLPPQNVQDLVNRADAIVVGTVNDISGPVRATAYSPTASISSNGHASSSTPTPSPGITVTYYTFAPQDVMLDDDNVRTAPRLRLSGGTEALGPQLHHQYLFVLLRNPDRLSYGAENWGMIDLSKTPPQLLDGSALSYSGISDAASLRAAIESALRTRVKTPPNQWPKIPFDNN